MALVPVAHPRPPGTWAYIDYGVAGEPWHERLLLGWVGRQDYVVWTPDRDTYAETIDSPPLAGMRIGGM